LRGTAAEVMYVKTGHLMSIVARALQESRTKADKKL
jgi:hypothetical protein